jgi:quinol monooxygenase YgiN
MIIIAGFTLTEADKRDAAVQAHVKMVARGRKYDGCLDLSISADPLNPERINIFE